MEICGKLRRADQITGILMLVLFSRRHGGCQGACQNPDGTIREARGGIPSRSGWCVSHRRRSPSSPCWSMATREPALAGGRSQPDRKLLPIVETHRRAGGLHPPAGDPRILALNRAVDRVSPARPWSERAGLTTLTVSVANAGALYTIFQGHAGREPAEEHIRISERGADRTGPRTSRTRRMNLFDNIMMALGLRCPHRTSCFASSERSTAR